jgi:putative hydrolase of the HAD superfamily
VSSRDAAAALLIDLDGVTRRFDAAVAAAVEERHGLPPGTILGTALEWGRLLPAITGRVGRADWLAATADALAPRVGDAAAARAMMAEWDAYRGEVDPQVLAFVREVRAAGRPVGLATNATDDLHDDLVRLGIDAEFDVVVSSAVLGTHKPAPEFFAAACRAVGTAPARCLFVDDDDRNVRGARAAGLAAYRWSGPADLRYLRGALALN